MQLWGLIVRVFIDPAGKGTLAWQFHSRAILPYSV
jgi:hypothetical protein